MRSSRLLAAGALLVCLTAACGSTVGTTTTSQSSPSQGAGLGSPTGAEGPAGSAQAPGVAGPQRSAPRAQSGAHRAGRAAVALPEASTGAGTGPVRALPTSGFGWDAHNVYVGVSVETDASAIGGTLGVKTFDFGDQKRAFTIAMNIVNDHGGLFGRKIVPVWYDYASVGQDADQQAAVACATWFEDHHVVAVVSFVSYLATDNMFQCIKKHGSSMITQAQFALQSHLAQWSPWIDFNGTVVSADRLARTWVNQFPKLGFFGGWDTTQGAPGKAPVRIGVVYSDVEPAVTQAWHGVAAILKTRAPVTEIQVSDPTKLQSVVVKFRQDGVTHVFLDSVSSLFWPQQAEAQHYRPRLGLSTINLPQYYLQGVAPPQQLVGSLVMGFDPTADVDARHDPHDTPGRAACLREFRRYGYPPTNQGHEVMALTACDLVLVLAHSVESGAGFDLAAIHTGFRAALGRFSFASTWAAESRPNQPDPLAAWRPAAFDVPCGCYAYTTRRNQPVG